MSLLAATYFSYFFRHVSVLKFARIVMAILKENTPIPLIQYLCTSKSEYISGIGLAYTEYISGIRFRLYWVYGESDFAYEYKRYQVQLLPSANTATMAPLLLSLNLPPLCVEQKKGRWWCSQILYTTAWYSGMVLIKSTAQDIPFWG